MKRSFEKTHPRSSTLLLPAGLLLALCWTTPGVAQLDPAPELEPVVAPPAETLVVELVVPAEEVRDGWIEVTPWADDRSPRVVWLGTSTLDDGERRFDPRMPSGPAMVCFGGEPWGLGCGEVFLFRGPANLYSGPLEHALEWGEGVPVRGAYRLGELPMPGARVAVVPAGLGGGRPFTMPLGYSGARARSGRLTREVVADAEGVFELPPLVAGEYFLETILPSGRVHRSEPFELPTADAMREDTGAEAGESVAYELPVIDVGEGLVVEVIAVDAAGDPLPGVRVAARQGEGPEDLVTYQRSTGPDGRVQLSGFDVDDAVEISCQAAGFAVWRQTFELVPTQVFCDLQRLSSLVGRVVGPDGDPITGTVASLWQGAAEDTLDGAADEDGAVDPPLRTTEPPLAAQVLNEEGTLLFDRLPATRVYHLAIAAPGFEVHEQRIELEAGELLDLGTITLLAGRDSTLRVVDADSREPLEGVAVLGIDPPGAVAGLTDEYGELTFGARSDRPVTVRLAVADYAPKTVELGAEELAADAPIVLELQRPGWINAVVWDAVADRPCQGCVLLIGPDGGRLTTDESGQALSTPLEPGTYRVYRPRVDHLGSTVVEQTDAEQRVVRVERGRVATVRFGERRRGVRVRFDPPLGEGWRLIARGRGREERYRWQADGGGFIVRHRAGEGLELYLRFYDRTVGRESELFAGFLPPDPGNRDVVIPRPSTRVEGRATLWSGESLPTTRVRLMTLEHRQVALGWTHADGRFVLSHVQPGVYALHIGERSVQFVSLSPGLDLDLGTFQLMDGGF